MPIESVLVQTIYRPIQNDSNELLMRFGTSHKRCWKKERAERKIEREREAIIKPISDREKNGHIALMCSIKRMSNDRKVVSSGNETRHN